MNLAYERWFDEFLRGSTAYWLYVAIDCGTPLPRLARVSDPFGKLIARATAGYAVGAADIWKSAEQ